MSTVPAGIDAVQALFTQALPAGFQIGKGTLTDPEPNYLIVAVEDPHNDDAVSGGFAYVDMGASYDQESYDIRCELSAWVGDDDPDDVQTIVWGHLKTLKTALRTAPADLGVPGISLARITSFGLIQGTSGDGSAATLNFTVHVIAFSE